MALPAAVQRQPASVAAQHRNFGRVSPPMGAGAEAAAEPDAVPRPRHPARSARTDAVAASDLLGAGSAAVHSDSLTVGSLSSDTLSETIGRRDLQYRRLGYATSRPATAPPPAAATAGACMRAPAPAPEMQYRILVPEYQAAPGAAVVSTE